MKKTFLILLLILNACTSGISNKELWEEMERRAIEKGKDTTEIIK